MNDWRFFVPWTLALNATRASLHPVGRRCNAIRLEACLDLAKIETLRTNNYRHPGIMIQHQGQLLTRTVKPNDLDQNILSTLQE